MMIELQFYFSKPRKHRTQLCNVHIHKPNLMKNASHARREREIGKYIRHLPSNDEANQAELWKSSFLLEKKTLETVNLLV